MNIAKKKPVSVVLYKDSSSWRGEFLGEITYEQAATLVEMGIGQKGMRGRVLAVRSEELKDQRKSYEFNRILEICKDRRKIKCQGGRLDGNYKYAKPAMNVPPSWRTA